jgi:hypothetical protein
MNTTPPNTGLTGLLQIIGTVLNVLANLPVIGPEAELASVFLTILQTAMAAVKQQTGQPIDLTKIPFEPPV